jgi:ketosteroid isomerase-like protein
MTQADVDTVLAAIEAGNRQDADAFVAAVSRDVDWEDSVFPGLAGTYVGSAAVRDWFQQAVVEPWERIHAEVIDLVEAAPGRILVELRVTTRGQGSGVETELRFWQVVWLAEGLIVKRRAYTERAPALAAAELKE